MAATDIGINQLTCPVKENEGRDATNAILGRELILLIACFVWECRKAHGAVILIETLLITIRRDKDTCGGVLLRRGRVGIRECRGVPTAWRAPVGGEIDHDVGLPGEYLAGGLRSVLGEESRSK